MPNNEPLNGFNCSREDLPRLYSEITRQNPLLGRIERELRLIGWTEEEIRTIQLLAACKSNASLTEYAKSIENRIAVIHTN
jgi:hypothetical protein